MAAFWEGKRAQPLADPREELAKALDRPLGAPPLEELARPGMTVALLFDDPERQTPAALAIPVLLDRLNRAGVRDEALWAICAVGTHRFPTAEALRKKLGQEAYQRLQGRVLVHDPHSHENVLIGTTSRGTKVEVNPMVASADLVIGVGQCAPHPCAGYSGGYKIVMPGVASWRTVADHHFTWMRHYRSRIGTVEGNGFHGEIGEVGRLARLAFKVDLVLDGRGQVLGVFAGDPTEVQRKAAELLDHLYGVKVEEPLDLTIISAYPMEEGVQATKVLLVAKAITRSQGAILWVSPQSDPEALEVLAREKDRFDSATAAHRRLLDDMPPRLKDLSVSYVMQLVFFKELAEDFRVFHVTEGVDPQVIEGMGFRYFHDMAGALRELEGLYPRAKVAVFPSGGQVIPKAGWLA